MITPLNIESVALDYNAANTRLILLDYDGTLVPFERYPQMVKPDTKLLLLMDALSADPKNHVVLISGRDREYMEDTWRKTSLVLAAEHGAFYLTPGTAWRTMFSVSGNWTQSALPALKALTFQYEGSVLEEKVYSLAWHYRAIEEKITAGERRQILAAIRSLPAHKNFIVYDGDCTIELRTPGIDKGSFVAKWVGIRHYDFIMAIGDGETDEDLFGIFGKKSYTIKVGKARTTSANFRIPEQADVVPFIENLLFVNHEFERMKREIGLENLRPN